MKQKIFNLIVLFFIAAATAGCDNNVNDEPPVLEFNEKLTLSGVKGYGTVRIYSNTNWVVSSDDDWLTFSPTSGEGEKSLIVTAIANETPELRVGTIWISANEITKTLQIVQEGNPNIPKVLYYPDVVESRNKV